MCVIILTVFGILNISGVFSAEKNKYQSSQEKRETNFFTKTLETSKQMWEKRVYEVFPRQEGGILCDLLLGDRSALPDNVKDLYTRNGIAHILSISGLHISILGMGLYMLLRRTGMPLAAAAAAAGAFLVTYGLMTGMSVSAKRSILMFIIKLVADSIGRTPDKPTSFALTAVIVLLPRPSLMSECGFLLSFGSAAGIYFLAPIFSDMVKKLPSHSQKLSLLIRANKNMNKYKALSGLVHSLVMSASVTLTILPVTLWFFYEYPTWSILLNLIVLPLMSILVISGLLAMLVPGLGILGTPAYMILKFFETVCGLFDKLPFHNWNPGRPQIPFMVIYYLIWLSVVLYPFCLNKLKNIKLCKPKYLPLILFLCPLLFVIPKLPKNTFIMLDVGQGDGFIYYTDAREVYLIDGGSSSKKNVGKYVIKDGLKRFGLSHINAAFVSHSDTDHLSGLTEIMENRDRWGFRIDEVVLPGCVEEEMNSKNGLHKSDIRQIPDGLHNFRTIVDFASSSEYKNEIVVGYISAGNKWKSGRNSFVCLHPSKDFEAADANEMSECILVDFFDDENIKLLLTGDVQGAGEMAFTDELNKLCTDITILKTAHHGSKYSTTESFLSVANPKIALISAGKNNRYGHPHKEVLERLERRDIRILSTQECGNIIITIKKSGIRCRYF